MSLTTRFFSRKTYLLCAAVIPIAMANIANAALPAHAISEPATDDVDHGAYSVHSDPATEPQPDLDEAKAYDNFSLAAAYVIDGINWHGIYAEAIPENTAANVDFIVEIWGDDAGMPDLSAMKASYKLIHGVATAAPGTTGDVTRSEPDGIGFHLSPSTPTAVGGGPAVQYDADLPLTLLGPGDYWISIQALQQFTSLAPVFDPEWQWHLGDSGAADGFFSADLRLSPEDGIKGKLTSPDKDLAFELKGMVPEPSGLLLAIMSMVPLGLLRKKRS